MTDCDNVTVRELLPGRAAEALDASTFAMVDAHLATCGACRDELALLRRARRVMGRTPAIDSARIARAVVGATRSAAQRPRTTHTRWAAMRIAASLALAAAGLTTFGIWRGGRGVPEAVDSAGSRPAPVAASLAPPGGLAGLDEAQLNALLDDLPTLEAAPAAEPDAVVPRLADLASEEIQ